jgi:hypothetical protein
MRLSGDDGAMIAHHRDVGPGFMRGKSNYESKSLTEA